MPLTDWYEALLGRAMLPVALVLTPFLLARVSFARINRSEWLFAGVCFSLVFNAAIPLCLHLAGVRISLPTLAAVHASAAFLAVAGLRIRRLSLIPAAGEWPILDLLLFGLLAILVFPFTHLAGIDTYKWCDLATELAARGQVTWLVHPLSLLGYTARSYPSLHPLFMGGIRCLGATSVETAFYLTSLAIAGTGVACAHFLAQGLGFSRRDRTIFAALYTLAPVFVRYAHWGTGRGFFLALLPLFVGALARLPRASAWPLCIGSGILLTLSHKTGLVAVALLPLLRLLAPVFPKKRPVMATILILCSFAGSLSFAPCNFLPGIAGCVAGLAYTDLVRFGWMLPTLVVVAVFAPRRIFTLSTSGYMWLGLAILMPVSHHIQMYPAMVFLPFAVYGGMAALKALREALPQQSLRIAYLIAALTLAGATGIVAKRSIDATPERIHRAAMFVERLDPQGPFVVKAGNSRARIQGILTGCPRFEAGIDPTQSPSRPKPPPLRGPVRATVNAWAAYLRNALSVESTTDWYGDTSLQYWFIIDGDIHPPQNGEVIYDQDDVKVYRVEQSDKKDG